jgi:RND family efflux transporter MFP subunit
MIARWISLGVLVCLHGLTPPSALGAQGNALDCLIEPSQVVTISLPLEGLVETVTVDRGDRVQQGQVLATLESSVERANITAARVRVAMESAYKEGGVPLKELDEAETSKVLAEISLLEAQENRQLAEAELQRAEAALALRTVRSPIGGVVLQRLISPGEFSKQAPLLKLAQLDPLYVEVIVPVTLLGKVVPGMLVLVTPEPPLSAIYTAQVKVVDPVIDAASGTFGIRLELKNPDYTLPAGLKCKVRFPG